MRRQYAGDIGAGTEEGGVAERDDSGIAEDEIERQGEEHHDEDLAAERQVIGEDEKGAAGAQPGQDLVEAQAMRGGGWRRRRHAAWPNRPCGRQSSRPSVAA